MKAERPFVQKAEQKEARATNVQSGQMLPESMLNQKVTTQPSVKANAPSEPRKTTRVPPPGNIPSPLVKIPEVMCIPGQKDMRNPHQKALVELTIVPEPPDDILHPIPGNRDRATNIPYPDPSRPELTPLLPGRAIASSPNKGIPVRIPHQQERTEATLHRTGVTANPRGVTVNPRELTAAPAGAAHLHGHRAAILLHHDRQVAAVAAGRAEAPAAAEEAGNQPFFQNLNHQ